MRYEYSITDADKNTETIKAMSYKKLLKKLSSKYKNQLVRIKYINKHKKITLPGQKDLAQLEESIFSIDSTNIKARKALNALNDFYAKSIDEKIYEESDQMYQILLLEFAGLFNGPKGRIEQSFINDEVLKTALNVINNQKFYSNVLLNAQHIDN